MKKIFVYGTLRKGHRLHPHFLKEGIVNNESRFIEYYNLKGFDLYDYKPGNFPFIVKGFGKVIGEIYLIPDDLFYKINLMEISTGYSLGYKEINGSRVYFWYIKPGNIFRKIKSGDYSKFKKIF